MLENTDTGGTSEGTTDAHPIRLDLITTFEMDSLLTLLDARLMDDPPLFTIDQWSAALHLATMWHFDAIRKYAIQQIESQYADQSPLDRIALACKCQVGQWLHPAYLALCNRAEPLTVEEGEKLGYPRLMAICRLRESRYTGSSTFGRQRCGSCIYCYNGYGVEKCSHPITNPPVLQVSAIAGQVEFAVPFEV
ncbi:hypothetical protein FRB98_000664 [Tulasnella sp. 332]|nr:hypothetical protein FRB98_000664 [Tulasnella sp. 332]